MAFRIALVDDGVRDRRKLAALLRDLGVNVDEYPDASVAESVFLGSRTAPRPDLFFLDVIMGPPNGYALCRRLRADADLSGIPVIMTSSRDSRVDQVCAEMAGASGFLVKPFDRVTVAALLRHFMPEPPASDVNTLSGEGERGQGQGADGHA